MSRTRGLRGEFLLDRPVEHVPAPGLPVRLSPPDRETTVESAWLQGGRLVLKLSGVDSIEAAEGLRDVELSVPRPPADDGFLLADLIGCRVVNNDGRELGLVRDWQDHGGPVLIELDSGLLIPFAKSIFLDIDLANRRIRVALPEGLEEL